MEISERSSFESTATGTGRRDTLTQSQLKIPDQQPSIRNSFESTHSFATAVIPTESVPVTPGTLNIKIYDAKNLQLPFKCNVSNQTINKLLTSSLSSSATKLLSESVSKSQISGDLYSNITADEIPALITIPTTRLKKSLIYMVIEFDKTIIEVDAKQGTLSNPVFNSVSSFDVSRNDIITIRIFARIPTSFYPPDYQPSNMIPSIITTQPTPVVSSNSNENDNSTTNSKIDQNIHTKFIQRGDILLGTTIIDPKLSSSNSSNSLRLLNHKWKSLDSNTQFQFNITIDYKPNKLKSLSIDDFDLLKVIGKGSFGKVMQVKKKNTQQIYALKIIRKSHIVSRSEVTHTLAERNVLTKINNPFIVPMKFTFQSPEKLYLVLAFTNGGELFHHLQREGKFDLNRSRFYIAELLIALECLHHYDIIYRDLKPENILLDYTGHIALCDFGLCKLDMKDGDTTSTFCGTPEYLAPELLMSQPYTKVVDWWTLGILLYEMLTGLPPYYDENHNVMYRKILKDPLIFPDFLDRDSKSIISGLLNRDPMKRLGNNGAKEIKQHLFFKKIDWKRLYNKGYAPPYKPPVSGQMDTSNFDSEFTNELPMDSVVEDYLSESVQQQFGGCTYVGTERLNSAN